MSETSTPAPALTTAPRKRAAKEASSAAIEYCAAAESSAVVGPAGAGPAGLYRRGQVLRIPDDVTPEKAEALVAIGIFRRVSD